jgi:hypothetical protein
MKCEEVESIMLDYLDNTLDKALRDDIGKHLETCERCLDELKDYQLLLQSVNSEEIVQPGESLRINFYHMLHTEMNKLSISKNNAGLTLPIGRRSPALLKIAAGIALLVAGSLIGLIISRSLGKSKESAQVAQLTSEVQSMKEMMMFAMLKEESPSERIKAVNFTDELATPDDKILGALTKTLNRDRNVNVRLAAAYSLAKFADRQSVRDSLVASLSNQTEPILQVVLINILVEYKESSAIQPIQKILKNENTMKEVKDVAQKGIKVLI